jgi:CheY-like chemotaxis protein
MEKKAYSLPEAARLAGVSEDELRCAIKDGLLLARLLQNTGEYQIESGELQMYLRRTRRPDLLLQARKKRVLIIDDEINFANIMKLELERDGRIEAKFATWGKDGVMMAETYGPDLCLIDFMLPDITGDQVLTALREIKELKKTRMIVYSAHTRDAIRDNPNLEARLQELGADEFLSKSSGMRALIAKVYDALGLDNQTRVIRKK